VETPKAFHADRNGSFSAEEKNILVVKANHMEK